MNGKRLTIRGDLSAAELRRLTRRERDRSAAARMRAIAVALEGLTRAEAARLAGMKRQALRDAVLRYNAEGLAGLHDRPRPRAKPRLEEARRAAAWPNRFVPDKARQLGHALAREERIGGGYPSWGGARLY